MARFGKPPVSNTAEVQTEVAQVEVLPAEVEQIELSSPEVPAVAVGKVRVRAVHGLMIHPYKAMDIRHDAITEVDEVDSWLKSQIDAGKLQVV
jgi:hypothetical protein